MFELGLFDFDAFKPSGIQGAFDFCLLFDPNLHFLPVPPNLDQCAFDLSLLTYLSG